MVGIDYMLENGMHGILLEKGVLTAEHFDEIKNIDSDSLPLSMHKNSLKSSFYANYTKITLDNA